MPKHHAQHQTGLSICMIVRDEAHILKKGLQSIQDLQALLSEANLPSELIVVDTGSQDQSMALAQSFGAKVSCFKWQDDFAQARNASLNQAQYDWILILDADEHLPPESCIALKDCLRTQVDQELKSPAEICLQLPIWNLNDQGDVISVYRNFRLFPRHPLLRYQGCFHEQLIWLDGRDTQTQHLNQAVIYHQGFSESLIQKKNKHQRDLKYLQRQVKAEPTQIIHQIHLADSLFGAQCFDDALRQYRTIEDTLQKAESSNTEALQTGLLSQVSEQQKYLIHCQLKILELLQHSVTQPHTHEALDYLEQLPLSSQNHPQYWYLRGQIYRQNKNFTTAEQAFVKTLSFNQHPELLSHYLPAMIYELPLLQLLHIYRWQRLQAKQLKDFQSCNQRIEQTCLALIQKFPTGHFPTQHDNLYLFWLEANGFTQYIQAAHKKLDLLALNTSAQNRFAQETLNSSAWKMIEAELSRMRNAQTETTHNYDLMTPLKDIEHSLHSLSQNASQPQDLPLYHHLSSRLFLYQLLSPQNPAIYFEIQTLIQTMPHLQADHLNQNIQLLHASQQQLANLWLNA